MNICSRCGVLPVVLVTGRVCSTCIAATDTRFRFRALRAAITPNARRFVIARDGLLCRYCWIPVHESLERDKQKLEVDHIVGVRSGGLGKTANLLVSCQRCNRAKEARQRFTVRVLDVCLAHEQDPQVVSVYRARGLCA